MPQPTRVAHVIRADTEELCEHVAMLTGGLAMRRHETIVVGPVERRFREDLARRSVRWVNLPLPETLRWSDQRSAAAHLRRFFRTAELDLIHAHGFQAALTSLLAAGRGEGRPRLVCSPHGVPSLSDTKPTERALRIHGYRRVLRRCAAVIAFSEAEREALGRLTPAQRIAIVPYGVERRRRSSVFDSGQKRRAVGLHQDASVVVVKTALADETPVEDFLQAAALVSDELPNIEFAIIGHGPRLESLKELSHELRLSGSTVFLGSRPDAMDVVAACNILAVLRDDAAAAALALEGLSAGLRVVALDVPGMREVFAEVDSVPLVASSDHRAFADALVAQLEGMTVEEDEVEVATGMSWGVSEVLASQDEFDLDRPGLDPVDRTRDSASDVERLLERYSEARMALETMEVYARVLARRVAPSVTNGES